jgi:CRISPR-associated protein Cas1
MSKVDVLHGLQRERISHLFLSYGRLDVQDGALVLEDKNGVRVQIPAAGVSVLYLEPGTSLTHAAATLAAACDTQICFVGEQGTRTYSIGRPVSGSPDNLLTQVRAYADEALNLKVVHRMYELRFGEPIPSRRSLEQLRGIEGARVRETYKILAKQFGVAWGGRNYNKQDRDIADPVNRALSAANSCMHGLCEAVIASSGFSPAIGFIHHGGSRSFVYDIADLYKFSMCAPLAFKLAVANTDGIERVARQRMRDIFSASKHVNRILGDLDSLFRPDSPL